MLLIELVLFDLDDVLGRYNRPAHIAHIARLSGRRPEDVYASIWESGFDGGADAGEFDAHAYLFGCSTRIGCPFTREDWLAGRKACTEPIDDVLTLVRAARSRARVAVLTNNTTLVTDHIDELLPELRPLFGENIFASAMLGAAKPNPEVYKRCVAKLNASPEQTLFVDDSLANVEGARSAGLHAHHYISAERLSSALRMHFLL